VGVEGPSATRGFRAFGGHNPDTILHMEQWAFIVAVFLGISAVAGAIIFVILITVNGDRRQ
jgi:hypothetical protein